jgi:hypothetical protein
MNRCLDETLNQPSVSQPNSNEYSAEGQNKSVVKNLEEMYPIRRCALSCQLKEGVDVDDDREDEDEEGDNGGLGVPGDGVIGNEVVLPQPFRSHSHSTSSSSLPPSSPTVGSSLWPVVVDDRVFIISGTNR